MSLPNDEKNLRDVLSRFATGVTVVTACDQNGQPLGLTVNSFTSVSLDPPLILWCLGKQAGIFDAISACEHYAINILASDQEAVSQRFAGPEADRFSGVEFDRGQNNVPLLRDCCAHIECRSRHQYEGGDHIIFVGEVTRIAALKCDPLVFFEGRYRTLTPA